VAEKGDFDMIKSMKNLTYRVIIEPDEKGTYHAYVPALKGCHTWGESVEEAKDNIRDAMNVYLRSLIADREKVPEDLGFESFETFSFSPKSIKTFA
jgi:predicted RNase H-like HicB family nuclease